MIIIPTVTLLGYLISLFDSKDMAYQLREFQRKAKKVPIKTGNHTLALWTGALDSY